MRIAGFIAATLLSAATWAHAQDSALRSLQTGIEASPWAAVGRLNLAGAGFCTGALIEPDLVLTAAHCLFDKTTGARIDPTTIEFLAGWRHGRASAYRDVRRAVIHPEYAFDGQISAERVRNDLALLELTQPIRDTRIIPFATAKGPLIGDHVGIVSYGRARAEAPSLQDTCEVLAVQDGVLVTSCAVDFGSSGAPIFVFSDGAAQIVSVVSAKAEMPDHDVSLGTDLAAPLVHLRASLERGGGFFESAIATSGQAVVGSARRDTGAKFISPGD